MAPLNTGEVLVFTSQGVDGFAVLVELSFQLVNFGGV